MKAPVPLGDSHNFGRRVSIVGDRVRKPRAVLWEWLLLSAESPLRKLLAAEAEKGALGEGAFDFLPDLAFDLSRVPFEGEVERIALEPLPDLSPERRRELAAVTGRALALFSWLGLSDLHWENLVLGLGPKEQIVFAPLDVEMILAELSLPTETKLLPDPDPEYAELCRHAAGVRRVLPYLGKPVGAEDLLEIASSYRKTLVFLDRHTRAIAHIFAQLRFFRDTAIRICLRSTGDYVRARSEELWPPLLEGETEQMARGDIPYFLRLYGRPGIHYFGDENLRSLKTLPSEGDMPQLEPLLPVERDLRSQARTKLREEGLFAVLGAFDHRALKGTFAVDGMEVTFTPRAIEINLPKREQLRTKRDLRGLVGSVYLPCTCGEVRSVFVPPVTICEGAR